MALLVPADVCLQFPHMSSYGRMGIVYAGGWMLRIRVARNRVRPTLGIEIRVRSFIENSKSLWFLCPRLSWLFDGRVHFHWNLS